MSSPAALEREHTLLTAAARYDALRRLELDDDAGVDGALGDPSRALELLALSEVIVRKAGCGRQLTVRAARAAGASWAQIGLALGTSRQAAWEGHQRWTDEQAARPLPHHPPPTRPPGAATVPAPDAAEPVRPHPLITADELSQHAARGWRTADGTPVRVLDVRWRLGAADGREQHAAGHVPGAVFVDLDTELALPADQHGPEQGRHPLPARGALQAAARRWGLDDGDAVVVYDDWSSLAAARAWWLLRHAGVADVRVLDGALPAWRDAGHPLETGAVVPEPGGATLGWDQLPVLTADQAAALPAHGVLLDARAVERYRGDVEPVDPVGGHVPGARSVPTTHHLDDGGRFRSPEELRESFAAAGAQDGAPVGAYCGSGVTASHTVLALELAGVRGALYPGSWSQWSNTPGRPVATGAEPGGAPGGAPGGTADEEASR